MAARAQIGADRFMWGSDYHDEGTHPFARETLRQVMCGIGPDEKQRILGENCAKLYDFDLAKLAPLAAKFGPTVAGAGGASRRLPDNANDTLLRSASDIERALPEAVASGQGRRENPESPKGPQLPYRCDLSVPLWAGELDAVGCTGPR